MKTSYSSFLERQTNNLYYHESQCFPYVPNDIAQLIFQKVDYSNASACLSVCKLWSELKDKLVTNLIERLYKKVINPGDWNLHFGDNCIDPVEMEEAKKTFPLYIETIPCPLNKNKKMLDTFVFVYFPKNITIRKYKKLLEFKLGTTNGFNVIWEIVLHEHGDTLLQKHGWKAMSMEALENSIGKIWMAQQEMVYDLNKHDKEIFRIPLALEAIICISTLLFKENKKIFDKYYTRCNDTIWHLMRLLVRQSSGMVITGWDLGTNNEIGIATICDF